MKADISKRFAAAAVIAALSMGTSGIWAFAEEASADNVFTFTDSGITSSEDAGANKIKNSKLTINESGTYVITGECVEGTIKVEEGVTGVVLIFDDLTLSSSSGTPVNIKKGAEVEIVVKGENTVSDKEDPTNENSADSEVADAFDGAAIKVKSSASLTISGTGTLNIDGSDCKNGIKGGASANVTLGKNSSDTFTLNIKAANNALAGDDSVVINSGTVDINAGGDGVKASPDEGDTESAGTVTINGGNVSINSTDDGIQADGGFIMNGGRVDITATGGHTTKTDEGGKGIKSDSSISISGGELNIDSADDAIHLNGTNGIETVSVTGGKLNLASGDDGIHSDYYLNIGTQDDSSSPEINITYSYEGLEGAVIRLYSGSGKIYSTDDGINAANGDLTNYKFELDIFGGSWYINANGDGLDSNGDINISGGDMVVFGSADNGNAALDYGDRQSSLNVTGGKVMAVGMNGMAVTPTSGTYVSFGSRMMGGGFGQGQQQNSQEQTVNITNGTMIEIKDSSGNTVYSATAVKNANSVIYSGEGLKEGETYTLYLNSKAATTATAAHGQQQSQGGFPGGGGGGSLPGGSSGRPDRPGNTPPNDGGEIPAPPSEGAAKGDVNVDGSIDIEDAVLIVNYINGITPLSDEQFGLADVDNSGVVDIEDTVKLINFINGVSLL